MIFQGANPLFNMGSLSYIFYNNVYVTAFLDKDVETDIIPYSNYGNREVIELYNANMRKIHFLPFTPEVLLYMQFRDNKAGILEKMKMTYYNQQLDYDLEQNIDLETYNESMPIFSSQKQYKSKIEERGQIRNKCKKETKRIAESLASQLNIRENEVYNFVFKFAVDDLEGGLINVRALLAQTIKRCL